LDVWLGAYLQFWYGCTLAGGETSAGFTVRVISRHVVIAETPGRSID
jgi:hypothetical protein